jgi:hypothetical protein
VYEAKGREYVSVERQADFQSQDFMGMTGAGIRPLDSDWTTRLMNDFAGHKDPVGMVGGRLLTGRNRWFGHVVSCGYTWEKDGCARPIFAGCNSFKKGYFRWGIVPRQVSAVSLDFCVVDRTAMERVGGVDYTLPSPYRDLDFAFRLRRAGYQVILDAGVAATIPKTGQQPQMREVPQVFFARWQEYIEEGDPFYNENIRCIGGL